MDALIIESRRQKWLQDYNCSFYDYNTIPYESRRHPMIAAILFVCFSVFELLYVPSLIVLLKKKNRCQPCYLLMLCLMLIDMLALTITALFSGLMLLNGEVFCSSPKLFYAVGVYSEILWCGELFICMSLAVNRCLTIIWGKTASRLFGITQTRWLILVIVTISLLCATFTPPILFNSIRATFFFNPHESYFPDPDKKVGKINFSIEKASKKTATTLFFTYGGVAIYYVHRAQNLKKHKDFSTFVQVLIINCISVLGPLSFAIMQVVEYPAFIHLISTIFLSVVTKGSSSIVYLTLNRKIKNEILEFVSKDWLLSFVSKSGRSSTMQPPRN
uniref:G-protein coupled receptors family 1 profile domain-containing protein n=1 Tax=Ditylenchus dipsaci TaxID=166011 RepID=A0A915ES68_9BILA